MECPKDPDPPKPGTWCSPCPWWCLAVGEALSQLSVFAQNQSQAQPLLKTPPAVLQPIAQQTFGVQAQPQPQSLLQAQISAASITPLLQTQPQPLLQQPQQKGAPSVCSFLGVTLLLSGGWLC